MARIRGTVSQEILHKLYYLTDVPLGPYNLRFWPNLFKMLFEDNLPARERIVKDAFYYLKKRGLILGEKDERGQLYIRLTPVGERAAGKYQINQLKIEPQKKWDHKWRLIIFDVPEKSRIKRDAFRGKLKELGFYKLQKSVWVMPYPCEKEIKLLREFFNLGPGSLRFFEVLRLEEDQRLRDFFRL